MDLIRVSKKHPCKICGHTDWCSYNSRIAICMRVQSPYQSRNGGWVHPLEGGENKYETEEETGTQVPRAADTILDNIYRRLLQVLTLEDKHYEHLRGRGMSDDEIRIGNYRTLPAGDRSHILTCFAPEEVRGVPGFGQKKHRLILTGRPGLIIPIVSPENKIVALLIRPDQQEKRRKYVLLSSRWLENGASPGARLHLAVPPVIKTQTLWITEGPLKANIAAFRLQAKVIAVPGVSNWRGVVELNLPHDIVLAYDSDYEKFPVRFHARKLANILLSQGHNVTAALWEGAKGLDDALVAGVRIRRVKLKIRPLERPLEKGGD